MKKIAVLGCTSYLKELIETIGDDQRFQIHLFEARECILNYSLTSSFLMNQTYVSEYFENKFFSQKFPQVTVHTTPIKKFNPHQKKITLENKEVVQFDEVIVLDWFDKKNFTIKGAQRERVFDIEDPLEMQKLKRQLPLLDSVIVDAKGFHAIELAHTLNELEKEVLVILDSQNFQPFLKDEEFEKLLLSFEKSGIRFLLNEEIIEVLGDQTIKAIRCQSDKVYAADALLTRYEQFSLRNVTRSEQLDVTREQFTQYMSQFSFLHQNPFLHQSRSLFTDALLPKTENELNSLINTVFEITNKDQTQPIQYYANYRFKTGFAHFCFDQLPDQETNRHYFIDENTDRWLIVCLNKNMVTGFILWNLDEVLDDFTSFLKTEFNLEQLKEKLNSISFDNYRYASIL